MDGFSARQVDEHWRVYEEGVTRANALLERLERGGTAEEMRALRRELPAALNDVKRHAVYFSNLGGRGGEPAGALAELVRRDFGSPVGLERDLKQAAFDAESWALVVLDADDGRLYVVTAETAGHALWEGSLLVALDVAAHAYFLDHGANRVAYVEAFFRNLDWQDADLRAQRALRRHLA